MFAALAATRFAHFAAICLLFGLAAFPLYAGREVREHFHPQRTLLACSVAALVSGAMELLATVGNMGDSWRSAFDPAMLGAAASDTMFGRVWLWRLALAAAIVALCGRRFPGRAIALPVAAGLLLASVALTGHSALPGGIVGSIHQLADAVHLLAAGWWIGGLLALLLLGRTGEAMLLPLRRLSRIGYAAVALLILSGLIKSALLVSPISAIFTTGYGLALLAKVALFGVMGLIALSNRFRITPALASGSDDVLWRRRLMRQVSAEFALGVLVLMIVGALGAAAPPVSQ